MEAGKAPASADGGHSAPPAEPAGHDAGTRWDYAPAPESREIAAIAPEYGLFVNGEFAPAASGRLFPTVNPAT